MMVFSKPLEELVKTRRSVRTYTNTPIPQEMKDQISNYIQTLKSPFPAETAFKLIETLQEPNGVKLGTYGMIKGASVFIGAATDNSEFAVEGLGYEFEQLILFLTSHGLGTCWLGGTFNRGEFKKAMGCADGALFPAISPVGYFERKSFRETLVRGVARSDTRKAWENLYFEGDFKTPLKSEVAGTYAFPLEMVRLAPSASNKQPWRIVKSGDTYHFYEYKTPGYSGAFNFDMQGIDMGIAACHFHLAVLEKGLKGSFEWGSAPSIERPENVIYKFSWIAEY